MRGSVVIDIKRILLYINMAKLCRKDNNDIAYNIRVYNTSIICNAKSLRGKLYGTFCCFLFYKFSIRTSCPVICVSTHHLMLTCSNKPIVSCPFMHVNNLLGVVRLLGARVVFICSLQLVFLLLFLCSLSIFFYFIFYSFAMCYWPLAV